MEEKIQRYDVGIAIDIYEILAERLSFIPDGEEKAKQLARQMAQEIEAYITAQRKEAEE